MIVNGEQIGVLIPGTWLEYLGKAPRKSATQRAAMGWYHCTRCDKGDKSIKMIRQQSVTPSHTVSCGCKGKKQFKDHHEAIADTISTSTRRAVFAEAYRRRKNSLLNPRYWTSITFNLSRHIVDFVIKKHFRFLRAVAALGKAAMSSLSYTERYWALRIRSNPVVGQSAYWVARCAAIEAMHWRDRAAFLAKENEEQRQAYASLKAIMEEKDCGIGEAIMALEDAGAVVALA